MLGTRQTDLESVNPWAYGFIVGKGYTRCYRHGVSVRDNLSMKISIYCVKVFIFQEVLKGLSRASSVAVGVGRGRFWVL